MFKVPYQFILIGQYFVSLGTPTEFNVPEKLIKENVAMATSGQPVNSEVIAQLLENLHQGEVPTEEVDPDTLDFYS